MGLKKSKLIQDVMIQVIPEIQIQVMYKFGNYFLNDIDETYGLWYYVNGVKIEWQQQSRRIKIGFGHSERDYGNLIDFYISRSIGPWIRSAKGERLAILDKDPEISDFLKIFEATLQLPFALEKKQAYGNIELNTNDPFLGMSKIIKMSLRHGLHLGSRCYGLWDVDYDDVFVNKSSLDRTYREHLVPCKVIMDECIESVRQSKRNIYQVAELIKQNLKVAYITADEAGRIDKKYKQIMPENWKFGDSVYARLFEFDVEIYDFVDEKVEGNYKKERKKYKSLN